MTQAWGRYTEALRVLTEAPNTAVARRVAIADAEKQRIAAADKLLRTNTQQREQLEQRLRKLADVAREADALVRTRTADPPPVITVPDPATAADVIRTADLLTERIEHATKCLAEARRRKERRDAAARQPVAPPSPPPPPPRTDPVPPIQPGSDIPWPMVVAGVIGTVVLLVLILVIAL